MKATAQIAINIASLVTVSAVAFFLLQVTPAHAATGINDTINFQGKVVNSDGTNVTNGSYDFTFRIYTAASGGVPVWTENWNTGTAQVTVTNGIFQVALGTHTDFPGSVDFNSDNIYLSIEFNGDGEMDPRVRFAAVPYAFNAEMVNGLTVTNNGSNTLDIGNGLTLAVNTASKTLTGAGTSLSFANNLTFGSGTTGTITLGSSTDTLSLATSGATSLTLPTTGTLATLAGSEILNNKTIGSAGLIFSGAATDITTAAGEALTMTGNAASTWSTSNGLLSITGDDGITLTATSTAGITGNVPDNITDAWDIQQGTNNYININTTDSSERVTIGNSSATNTGVTIDINGTGTVLLPDFANCTALETASGVLTCGVDDTGGALTWNSIQVPTGNATLAMDADTTTWNWDTMTTQNAFTFGSAAPGFSSGDLVRMAQTSGATATDGTTISGNVLDISRSLTIDVGGARSITVNSPVVTISDNCTVGASDTCTHTGNVLSLTQSYAPSTGTVLAVSNAGTGALASLALANASGTRTNGLLIDQSGAGTTTNAFHITNSAGSITDSILIDGTAPTGNYLNTATIDITSAGAITGATGVSTTTVTASSAIAANGGITFDQNTDTIGSHTAGGTILMNSNILQDIGNTGTDFIASTGALTLAGVLTANGGVTVSGGQNLTMSSGTGLFSQTHAVTTDATADAHTITLSAGGTGSTGTLRGLVVSQSDTGTNGVYDSLGYFVNLKTPETTTNGILIEQNAGSGTLTNALHITNTAGTLTDAILIDGTAASGNILNTGSLDITGAGAITGATGITLSSGAINVGNGGLTNAGSIAGATTITASSAIAANGGITFDNSSDTLGAFTAAGTIDLSTQILTNIGNTGTDFIASTGALTLAGVLTANGGVTVSGGQNLTMSSGTGLFSQTHAPTTDATADAFTLSLSPGGTGSTNVLRGMVITQSDTGTTGVYDSLLYLQNLKTPETTTNGLFIEHNASSGTMSNGLNITNTAGTLTTGISMTGTFTNLFDTPTFDVSNAGTVTLAASQSYTGSGAITLSSGGAGALTLDSASNSLVLAANDTTLSRTASGTYSIDLVDGATTTLALINSGAGVAQLQIDSLTAAACDVKADTSGFLSCGTDAGAAASPFGSSGGVVTKTTSSDQVRLTMAQSGDYGLLVDASTVPTVDLLQLTNSGQGITSTSGVDAMSITYVQATNATAITGSAIDINLTASGDASDVIRAITINNITAGSSTETGLYIGTGYDRDLELADTSPTIVLGGNTAFTDGTNTLMSIIDSGTYGTLRLSDKGGTGDPASCTAGDIYFNDTDNTFKGCTSTNTWEAFDNGADSQLATATMTETTVAGTATFVTGSTAAVTPTTATGDVYVTVDLWTKSLSNTDQTITLQIRTTSGTTCGGSLLASATAALTSANGSNGPGLYAAYLSVDPGASSQSFSVCALSTTASGASVGGWISVQVIDSGADLAEFYTTSDPNLNEGDVVSLDPTLKSGVKKSNGVYDKNVLGIVSTRPGLAIGSVDKEGVGAKPVALSGRVPVKVSTENGPIKAGDLLTSSSTPGVAMKASKAGQLIAQAMSDFNQSGTGEVLAFVKTDFWTGASSIDLTESGQVDQTSNSVGMLKSLMNQKNKLQKQAQISEVVTDRLIAGLELITPLITADELMVNTIKGTNGQDVMTIDEAGNTTFKGTLTADKIRANQIEGLSILAEQIVTNKLEQAKESTPSTTLAQTQLSGPVQSASDSSKLSVDTLKVQNESFFEGVVQILETLSTRNLIVSEWAKFLSDVFFEGSVTFLGRATFNADTAGTAIVKKDAVEVEVTFEKEYPDTPLVTISLSLNDNLTPDQKALVSPEEFAQKEAEQNDLEAKVLSSDLKYIVTRKTKSGFFIKLNKPAETDLQFSWQATSVADPKTFESKLTHTVASPNPQASPITNQIATTLTQIEGVSTSSAVLAGVTKQETSVNEKTEAKLTINSTETGFLRVRKEPKTNSEEVGQVTPGSEYVIQEQTQGVGDITWYKIEFAPNQTGWVKGSYVTLPNSSPSPTASVNFEQKE